MTDPAAESRSQFTILPSKPRELLVSVFSTLDGSPLGKIRGLDLNGNLRKASSAALTNGRADQARYSTLMDFLDAVRAMGAHQALGFGISVFETARVVTKERLAAGGLHEPVIARTKDCFSFREGPGILQIDYDPRPGTVALSPTEIVRSLCAAVPELRGVTMCCKPSSSSNLTHPDGSVLVGTGGAHIFIPVMDATQIPLLGQIIVDRLWLAGHGYTKISGAGVMIEATIMDQSVLSPERLCFVRATCEDGVTQDFPMFGYRPSELDDLLGGEIWLQELTPLTDQEHEEVKRLKADARTAAQPEADRVRQAWAEKQADRRIAIASTSGTSPDRAALVKSFLEPGELVLARDLVLHPHGQGAVTAAEVLADPLRWNGVRFADPFEPDYGDDPRIALAVMDRGEPYIMSHAHGGLRYHFRSDADRAAACALEFADLRQRRPFQAISADDFVHGAPLSWLVKDVIPKAALGVLYGPSGSGKSFLALALAASVALGTPWNDLPTKQGNVVYICAEGASGFRKRVLAYSIHHGVKFGDALLIIGDQPDLLSGGDITALLTELKVAKPVLVIIDTLAQVMPGGDENSAIEVGKVLKVCRQIHESLGAMVMLVHHAGKDLSKGARGWSGLRAAADVEISVGKSAVGNVATITKMKDGDDQAAYAFKLRPVDLPSVEGETVNSCIVEYRERSPAAVRAIEPKGARQRAVLKAAQDLVSMSDSGASVADVLDLAVSSAPFDPGPDPANPKRDQRRGNLKRALDELCDKGVLFLKGGQIFTYDPDASCASNASNEADE